MQPTRAQALNLFKTWNSSESLMKHALAVEAVMRHFAAKTCKDTDKWGIIGLIHDLDWEKHPEQHCAKTREILMENGWPEDYIRAVESHGWGICTKVEPIHHLEKVLFATDELTGLVTTAVLVRPYHDIQKHTVKSDMKKWKDKRFAAGVNREIILKGAEMLGIELEELISETILAMQDLEF